MVTGAFVTFMALLRRFIPGNRQTPTELNKESNRWSDQRERPFFFRRPGPLSVFMLMNTSPMLQISGCKLLKH